MQRDGKTPFLSITVSCPDGKYNTLIDCAFYGKSIEEAKQMIKPGDLICCSGEFSARAYMKQGADKPSSILGMFVRSFSVLVEGVGNAVSPASSSPSKLAQAIDATDDVPF